MFNKGKVSNVVIPILFAPIGNRPLTECYPELNEIPIFKDISPQELLFTWYYSILYANVPTERDRIAMSISEAYGNLIADDAKNSLMSGNWSSKLREAIDKMSNFSLTARLKNRKMIETIFQQYQDIINEGHGSETEEKQKYVALTKNIIEILPSITKGMETNFGVSEIDIEILENNSDLTDGFYRHKKSTADNKV